MKENDRIFSDDYSISYLLKESEYGGTFCRTPTKKKRSREDVLHIGKPWFLSCHLRLSGRASIHENCLYNNRSEHSPISLLSWLPYNCCMHLQSYVLTWSVLPSFSMPTFRHFMKRQAWQDLRLRFVISHSFVAGQLYSMLPVIESTGKKRYSESLNNR